MKSNFFRRVEHLARFFRPSPVSRSACRPCFRPILESLEERALLSTLGIVNLGGPRIEAVSGHPPGTGSNNLTMTTSANPAVSGTVVFHATDVPQRVDFPDVFTTSYLDVPPNLTIASLKVQLNITYPLDNDLTIDLIGPDGTDVPLSSFEGSGANFQNTVFSDSAATPIWAGNSPFAGSYRPESPLSAFSGQTALGIWELEIIDWGASSGTLNSWSLIIQPADSPNAAVPHAGTPLGVTATSPTPGPTGTASLTGFPMAGRSGLTADAAAGPSAGFSPSGLPATRLNADQTSPPSPAAGNAVKAVSAVQPPAAFDPIQSVSGLGSTPQTLPDGSEHLIGTDGSRGLMNSVNDNVVL
jgi:subtilisin-like proprotein convertase family protein